jgi:hypothetical protein
MHQRLIKIEATLKETQHKGGKWKAIYHGENVYSEHQKLVCEMPDTGTLERLDGLFLYSQLKELKITFPND